MQNSLNIIIIGAGLVGLSSADLLALAGHRVTVIESQHGPVYGASYSNSGMLHPSQSWPWLVDKKKGDASTAFKVADLRFQRFVSLKFTSLFNRR